MSLHTATPYQRVRTKKHEGIEMSSPRKIWILEIPTGVKVQLGDCEEETLKVNSAFHSSVNFFYNSI